MKQSNQGYSIILSVLMVGFMLVLTHGVLTLVIGESKDSMAVSNSLKAYAAAEGSLELGMLEAKNTDYGTDIINIDFSEVFYNNGGNNKDAKIQYEIDGLVNEINNQVLGSGDFAIIPMFDFSGNKVTQPRLIGINQDVVWNILSENSGLAKTDNFDKNTSGKEKKIINGSVSLNEGKKIQDFLQAGTNNKNYLILQNTGDVEVSYTLRSDNTSEVFTNTTVKIVGSGEVGGWKQNVFVEIDTQKYLNLLKYSVFSPD